MSEDEIEDRARFAYEACVIMRDRIQNYELGKKFFGYSEQEAREAILEQLKTLQQLHPDKMKAVIEAFKDKFNIKSSKISGHITTAEHGEFLALEISKIDESL